MDSSHHRLRATAIVSQAGVDLTQLNEIERWTQTWPKFKNLNFGLLELWMRLREKLLKRKKIIKKIEEEKLLKKDKYVNKFSKIC